MSRGLGRSGTYLLGGLGTLTPPPAPEFFTTAVEILSDANTRVRLDSAQTELQISIALYEAIVIDIKQTEVILIGNSKTDAPVVRTFQTAVLVDPGTRKVEVVK